MESREHILAVPKWTLILRIVSLVIAVIVLGLNAYGIHYYAFEKLIFSLVTCLLTFGVVIYMIVATLATPRAYNMWAFLALDTLMVIFWLCQFAVVGSLAAWFNSYDSSYTYYYGYYWKRDLTRRDSTTYGAYWGALVAGAVLGAFNFVIFLVNLIIFSIALHHHRMSGAPTTTPPGYTGNAAVPGAEKFQQQPQQIPQQPQPVAQPGQYYAPQQPQYTQPQYTQPQQPAPPQFTTPYTQPADPINRGATISPVTDAGQSQYGGTVVSELSSPQHTGNPYAAELQTPQHTNNPNAAELGPR